MPSPIQNWQKVTNCLQTALSILLSLRKGIKFHNGDPFTADDVKFTFDRLRAKDSGYSYTSQVETISSIEVIDPQTVQFKLEANDRTFPDLYGVPWLIYST